MKRYVFSGVALAASLLLAGCNLSDLSGPKVKVSQCWSDGTNQTVAQIVEPNLKTGLQAALGILGVDDAMTRDLTIRLKLSYQHPIKADPEIGAVECNASADATITTPAHPNGVVLHADDLNYSIYPGKDGAVITASTAAFSDALQAHLSEIAKLVRPAPQPAPQAPAPQAQPTAPALIPQAPAESAPASAPASAS
ncbi:hypothetical protein [Thiomonas intermedia]|uniref:hypothetical protein n=1 Tax=Thiomonas intermedia TaxID=926 RepID=UPI0012ABEDE1|nr:hypothetical protein [Thiomonas intermedia]